MTGNFDGTAQDYATRYWEWLMANGPRTRVTLGDCVINLNPICKGLRIGACVDFGGNEVIVRTEGGRVRWLRDCVYHVPRNLLPTPELQESFSDCVQFLAAHPE